jgi:hypothetical protein
MAILFLNPVVLVLTSEQFFQYYDLKTCERPDPEGSEADEEVTDQEFSRQADVSSLGCVVWMRP